MTINLITRLALLPIMLCLISACGGGGASSSGNTNNTNNGVTFTVTPTAGANGSLSPLPPQTVNSGATTSFTATAVGGYQIASVTGCGGTLSGTTYTTGVISGDCTVSASFSALPLGTSPASAILKISTSGTPSANLSGNDIILTLPDGVTPTLNADRTVANSVIAVSGVAAPGTVLAPVYTSATASARGTLHFAMASTIAVGFGAGEFATVTLNITAGKNPVQGDFSLSGFNPIDVTGNSATGLTAGFTASIQ